MGIRAAAESATVKVVCADKSPEAAF